MGFVVVVVFVVVAVVVVVVVEWLICSTLVKRVREN